VRLKIEIESTGPATNPNVVIVGLPRTTVKKSRDRVTTAIARGGYFGRAGKRKINVALADIKRDQPSTYRLRLA